MADRNMPGSKASYSGTWRMDRRKQRSEATKSFLVATMGSHPNAGRNVPAVHPVFTLGIVIYFGADSARERTMRKMILAAVAVIGFGFVGSATVSAAPGYGPALGAAAQTLGITQKVSWRQSYHSYRGGRCC